MKTENTRDALPSSEINTPLDCLFELIPWRETEKITSVILITERPCGGGSFMGNFWSWCQREGFDGLKAGTFNYPQSHGWYLHPEDAALFRAWLKNKLKSISLI